MIDLRRIANSLLRRSGVEVRLKPSLLIRSPAELLIPFDFAVAHLASRFPGEKLGVVQIGAFDGQSNDPVIDALLRFGWKGVLVEPQPGPFSALQRLHDCNDSIQAFKVAIGAADGERELFTIPSSPELPAFTQQVASFNRKHVERQQRFMPKGIDILTRIQATSVTTWTFETLLRRSNLDMVDVLVIDAEGYDYELLRLFEVERRAPKLITYEHQHLSRADRRAAVALLVRNGYRIGMTGGDTIAYASALLR